MSQIGLVAHEHDPDIEALVADLTMLEFDEHDIGICVIPKFFEPASDIDVSWVFRDIVYEKSANSSSVISLSATQPLVISRGV